MGRGFVIAAPNSGSGKTTIARGLMALFTGKGYRVQPFKCGPDYIDTKFHAAVCGRPSINLDTFMAASEHVRELYDHYGTDADVCVGERMMTFFPFYQLNRKKLQNRKQHVLLPLYPQSRAVHHCCRVRIARGSARSCLSRITRTLVLPPGITP